MMRSRFSLLVCEKGAAAAEMALILPLAVLILFSTLIFTGIWLLIRQSEQVRKESGT